MQIRTWILSLDKITETTDLLTTSKKIRNDIPPGEPALEEQIYGWVLQQRGADLFVSTKNILCKAISLEGSLKMGTVRSTGHGCTTFLGRTRAKFAYEKMKALLFRGVDNRIFVSIDETEIYFDS